MVLCLCFAPDMLTYQGHISQICHISGPYAHIRRFGICPRHISLICIRCMEARLVLRMVVPPAQKAQKALEDPQGNPEPELRGRRPAQGARASRSQSRSSRKRRRMPPTDPRSSRSASIEALDQCRAAGAAFPCTLGPAAATQGVLPTRRSPAGRLTPTRSRRDWQAATLPTTAIFDLDEVRHAATDRERLVSATEYRHDRSPVLPTCRNCDCCVHGSSVGPQNNTVDICVWLWGAVKVTI